MVGNILIDTQETNEHEGKHEDDFFLLKPEPATIPKDEVDKNSIVMRNLPNRAATVHMGKERRKKIDEELKHFKGATEAYSSHPFNKGGFTPNKINANEKWKPAQETQPCSLINLDKPKRVLRDSTIAMHQECSPPPSSWRVPPGTSRSRGHVETTVQIV